MEKGAELIAEGYSDSRIQDFGSQQWRCIEFCELCGYDWCEAGKHAMVAWIAYMLESTSISGDSIEQYVSTVNSAFETSGLAPPGRPQNCNRLYIEVKRAVDDFKRARLNAAGKKPVQHSPTPDFVIAALCLLVRKELTPPITIKKLGMTRSGLANIWQYF
jgi:hypothetical protein